MFGHTELKGLSKLPCDEKQASKIQLALTQTSPEFDFQQRMLLYALRGLGNGQWGAIHLSTPMSTLAASHGHSHMRGMPLTPLSHVQTMYFAALLRLPRSWTLAMKLERVEMVIDVGA